MTFPRNLSKSKLVAFRQCPKRLWLEVPSPNGITTIQFSRVVGAFVRPKTPDTPQLGDAGF